MSKNIELLNVFFPKMIDLFDHLPKASFFQLAHTLIYRKQRSVVRTMTTMRSTSLVCWFHNIQLRTAKEV